MKIEEGAMVTVHAGEYKEAMDGIVGLVTQILQPDVEGSTGEEPVYRVEFFSNRLKLPKNMPTWWPAGDLRVEE